jgi:hypothetical protein
VLLLGRTVHKIELLLLLLLWLLLYVLSRHLAIGFLQKWFDVYMLLDKVNFINTTTKERVRRASATAHALVVETFFLLNQTHDQALLLVKLLLIIKRHYAVWPTLKFIWVIDLLRPRRYTESLLAMSECSGSSHGIKLVVNAREVGPARDVTLVVLESCGLRLL